MKFEHLIQINDPLNPLINPLSIDQLWQGLVLRASQPMLFVPHLDACEIMAQSPQGISRRLRYGEVVIHDRVVFTPRQQVLYLVGAQKDIAESSLSMTIELAPTNVLFVRFVYDDGHTPEEDEANAMYDEFRRSAYTESDIDTIRVIRELAAQGRLNPPLNA